MIYLEPTLEGYANRIRFVREKMKDPALNEDQEMVLRNIEEKTKNHIVEKVLNMYPEQK